MRYQEYEPPIELSPWIKLFWVFECRSNHPSLETIVADGFPELIIHFRTPFSEEGRVGQFSKQPVAVACGQLTKPLVLHSSADSGMIGIRFRPCGMAPFLSAPMKVITDARVSAECLFDGVDRLVDEVMACVNDAQRVEACNRFLFRAIRPDRESCHVKQAVARIMRTGGNVTVDDLAEKLGLSRRGLELAFQHKVGTTPKMYCRIVRFRRLMDAVSQESNDVRWVELALDSGFFDQPHLIRDFRQFTGNSPTAFLAEQGSFANSVNQA